VSRQRHGRFFIAKIKTNRKETLMQNQKTNNTFTKKIGGSTYHVQIFFSKTSKEYFNDKLLRLIKNDIAKDGKAS